MVYQWTYFGRLRHVFQATGKEVKQWLQNIGFSFQRVGRKKWQRKFVEVLIK